jgi:ubiquinone biosynthesis protein UbiJ
MDLALAMDSYHSQPVSQLEELRSLFMNVVNSCLDTTQNRLAEIFGEQEVKMDLKQQEVSQILWEVQSILDRTQQLSTKLNKLAA